MGVFRFSASNINLVAVEAFKKAARY